MVRYNQVKGIKKSGCYRPK